MRLPNYLREFVRLDGSGNDIIGTNVYRKKFPATGRWRELTPEPCCSNLSLEFATDGDIADPVLTLLCDSAAVLVITLDGTTTTTLEGLKNALNSKAGYVGSFNINDTEDSIVWNVKQSVANSLCADGTLTFTVT